jgi:hypothetical protein
MARKTASVLAANPEKSSIEVQTAPNNIIQGELATDPIPNIKVNNANLAEIKSSLDEAVKGVCPLFSSYDYHRRIYTHTERTVH